MPVLGRPRGRIGGVGTRRATCVDGADGGLLEDAPLHAGHRKVLSGKGPAAHIRRLDFRRVHVDESELVLPGLAPQAGGVVDRDLLAFEQSDAPAEVGLGPVGRREVENARALDEEVALFRETEREPREVEPALVDLRFGKVRVHAHARPQARREVVVDVETDVARVRSGVGLFRYVLPVRHRIGNRFESDSLRHSVEPDEPPSVYGIPEALVTPMPSPVDLLVLAADRALKVYSPAVRTRVEVQCAERNLDLERPPVRQNLCLNPPDSVPRAAPTPTAPSTTTGDQGVAHHTERVGFEEVAGATVPERIENPHKTVVGAEESIPPLLEGHDPLGIVIEHGADVERILVVDDPDLGPLRRRPTLHRLPLGEVRDRDGPSPRVLVESPIHVDDGTGFQSKRDEIDGLGVPFPGDEALGR